MQVSCQKCQAQFDISAEGLPKDKEIWLVCPSCHTPFPWKEPQETEAAGPIGRPMAADRSAQAAAEGGFVPFDVTGEGAETALICATAPQHLHVFEQALKSMGYYVATVRSAKEALIKLRNNDYNVFVMDDTFQGDKAEKEILVQFIQQMPIHARRNCFICLLSEEMRSLDSMAAFVHCANLTINIRDLERGELILKKAIGEFKSFYRVFRQEIEGLEKAQV